MTYFADVCIIKVCSGHLRSYFVNLFLFLQQIGWSANATSRRLVIFVTDAPFHVAGDGKVGT